MAIRGQRWVTASVASEGAILCPKKKDVGLGGHKWMLALKEQKVAVNGGALNGVWLGGTFSAVQ